MESTKNVYLITNGPGEDFLTYVIKKLSEKRVIFGSGFPKMEPKLEILQISTLVKLVKYRNKKYYQRILLELFKEKA